MNNELELTDGVRDVFKKLYTLGIEKKTIDPDNLKGYDKTLYDEVMEINETNPTKTITKEIDK